MSNSIIKLLPENVANQIAAGEVIQRPASVLKELMENAVDAGAKNIHVIIKEAGKTLIQVIDDGKGMSEEDAKMCFVRHATSKISSADDLFSIESKGFRGEAMASIASIAHVSLTSKSSESELGTLLEMEGGKEIKYESCQCSKGTSVSVKNIFFNVPARRKFLKSNTVEGKHINEEFTRLALIHPEIAFKLHSNDQEIYHLPLANFKQRIIGVLGKSYQERLVPIAEKTEIINISGFILKPEFAKKSRGEQYFFVNNRFIKHGYFHHAVSQAFEDLISSNSYPSYFISLEVDPKDIDINIHPTKTEVKFAEERSIYAMLKATIKRSLNQHSLAPTLDFNQETSFDTSNITWDGPLTMPEVKVDKNFNPFDSSDSNGSNSSSGRSSYQNSSAFSDQRAKRNQGWESLYDSTKEESNEDTAEEPNNGVHYENEGQQQELTELKGETVAFFKQLKSKYILTENAQGLLIVNQKRAHERVLFEHFTHAFTQKENLIQQLLFPETIEFSPKDMIVVQELIPDLQVLGFDMSLFGKNSIVINGVPADLKDTNPTDLVQGIVEQFNNQSAKLKLENRDLLAANLARKVAVKYGQLLEHEEMKTLCEQLFLCESPFTSPFGKPTLMSYNFSLIDQQLD